MKKLVLILSGKISGLHEAAYLLAFFAFLSQVLGLFRDRLLSGSFGAGETLDIYYAAFRIPDFIFTIVASLVSIWVLVPFLLSKEGKEEEQKSVDGLFTAFSIALFVSSIIGFFLAPYILKFLFPAIIANNAHYLILLSRILLLSPIFLGISNFFGSILQIRGRFTLYALSPILYNAGIIFGIIVLYPLMGIAGLGWGVALGALLHVLLPVPFLISQKALPKLVGRIDMRAVRHIIKISIPRTAALSVSSLVSLFLVSLASFAGIGAIAVFTLAFNLQSIPLSLVGASYSSAAFPRLSRLYQSGDKVAFMKDIVLTSRHVIFWTVMASGFFIVLSKYIVQGLLGVGLFGSTEIVLVSIVLSLFALSILPQSLTALCMRIFYAEGKTKGPFVMNLVSGVVTVLTAGIGLLLVKNGYGAFGLHFENVSIENLMVLPLAYSFGFYINLIIHLFAIEREYPSFIKSVSGSFLKTLLAVFVGGLSMFFLSQLPQFLSNNSISALIDGFVLGIVGLAVSVAILFVLKSQEFLEVLSGFKTKMLKTKTF